MIYFTSDTHYSHRNIIEYCNRPFSSTYEMDEELIKRYNEVVGPNDVVWHLGDFSMRFDPMLEVVPRLNGTKILVAGNHDTCHPNFKFNRFKRPVDDYLKAGWDAVFIEDVRTEIVLPDGRSVPLILSHYPRVTDKGFVFHGHVHTDWKIKGNNINVGVDQWDFTPVSIDTLKEHCK